MQVFTADEIAALAPPERLVEALRAAFQGPLFVPPRQVLKLPGGDKQRLFLVMPAFDQRGAGMVKLLSVFPENAAHGRLSIQAAIVVFSESGSPVAILDGTAVTHQRTGAASALASTYLSRAESSHLVIIGTGALAPHMAAAHAAVRPIRRISVCGRTREHAQRTTAAIRRLVAPEVEVTVAEVETAVASADIISCATNSATPVLRGGWLRPGAFVDLVGSFSPQRRESDDEVMLRSRIFVDTFEGALQEAGDILDPLARGVIARERIQGELADLVSGRQPGRINDEEILTFKSVGTAIEDLAAAQMILAADARDGR